MSNRKEIEKFILDLLYEILPIPETRAIYESRFAKLSDKAFLAFLEEAAAKGLRLIVPPGLDVKLNEKRNARIAERLGYKFRQRITMVDDDSGVAYENPVEHLILMVGCRRLIQTLEHKRSVPTNLSHIDERTGQATGPSKGSRISFPELNILQAQGATAAPIEFLKTRGGDTQAFNLFNRSIIQRGGVTQEYINNANTRPKAVKILETIQLAMHYDNNLASLNKVI